MQLPTRRQLTLLAVLFAASFSFSQSQATITGNVSSITGTTATSGIVQFTLAPFSTAVQYRVNGVTILDPIIAQCSIDSSGNIKDSAGTGSCLVWGNDNITPANTCYQVGFNPNGAGYDRVLQGVQITGASVDLASPTFCPSVRITPEQAIVVTDPINSNLIPASDNFFNLGAPTFRYQNGYFANLHVAQGGCIGCGLTGVFTVDGVSYTTIQAAITAAGTTGAVLIPSTYAGTDVYTNTNGIQILDLRRTSASAPSRYRGFINMLTDCGLKGDGTTDDAVAAQACFTAYPGNWFVFPQTKTGGACSYWFGATVFPKGEGSRVSGASSGFKNSTTTLGGTVICSAAGVTPLWLDQTPNSTSGITIENLSLRGSEGMGHLNTPTALNIPSGANLPQFTRNIASIQRAANVLTVVTTAIGNEGLTQQVGSTVKISGVVGDATMNGNCVIATLTGLNTFSENATGFTCAQNGADAGAFGAVGTVSLPTTGASTADGIRVCSNFNRIRNVTIDGFGRHGINADMQAGHGCTTLFADDLIIEDSTLMGNQGDGFYAQGIDSNAGAMLINPVYYNLLWGVEDQSALGNNWFGNQISNNGSQWATTATPATKAISTIGRVLTSGVSQVSVVLSVADANIKLGSCVFIAGVTDASFNTTAGQCFFVNSYTNSTHYGYEQPGAPADASSSGGTSRMAKFSEAYLSAGVDSGAVKVATQSLTYSQPWVGNYVEGGQACKFGIQVIAFGGANMPTCATLSTFKPASMLGTTPGMVASSLQFAGFANEKDQNASIYYKAGISGSTTRHTFHRWYNNTLSSDSWGLDVDPSGASGTTGTWRLSRGTAGSGNFRLSFFGATNANGITRLNSESTGAVQINLDANSGTGGFTVCSGGASPTCPASSSIGSDFGFFGPYFKSSTTNPASAGAVRLAKTDVINFRNNANGADVNGLSLDSSDRAVAGGAAGVSSAVFTSTTANPAASGAIRLAKTDQMCWRNNANGADVCISLNGSDQPVLPTTVTTTQTSTDNSTKIATTAFVQNYAPGGAGAAITFWAPNGTVASNTSVVATDVVRLAHFFLTNTVAFNKIGVQNVTADGVNSYSFGVFSLDGTVRYAHTTAQTMVGSGTFRALAVAEGTVTLPPGDYLFAWTGASTTATFLTLGSGVGTRLAPSSSSTVTALGVMPAAPINVPALSPNQAAVGIISFILYQ